MKYLWTTFVRSILKHPFKFFLCPWPLYLLNLALDGSALDQLHILSQNFNVLLSCQVTFHLWPISLSEGCFNFYAVSESLRLSSISEVALTITDPKRILLPYSSRLLINFSHSKIFLFLKCFNNCLFLFGCKDQVRVNYVIYIFMYIFNFSFVNCLTRRNKLRK